MNKVVHFEVPADDLDRAQKFYKEVFEWNIVPMPELNYTIVHTVAVDEQFMPKESGAINGGMYKRGGDSSPHPVIVIDVPSIDEHLKKVEAAGGRTVRPKAEIPNMGYYAQVADSEGNIIGLWETTPKK